MKKNSWDYKKMNEIEILLEKEIDSDLGSRNKIEELYKNIDSNVSKVVMNFKGVEFMGRSFAQEYLKQKHLINKEIREIRVPQNVDSVLKLVKNSPTPNIKEIIENL